MQAQVSPCCDASRVRCIRVFGYLSQARNYVFGSQISLSPQPGAFCFDSRLNVNIGQQPITAAADPLAPAEILSNTSDSDTGTSPGSSSLSEQNSQEDREGTPCTDKQTEIDRLVWALVDQIGQ